jgi:hypothetical protein
LLYTSFESRRCQAFRSAGTSKIKIRTSPWHKDESALCHGEVRILIFDDPAELEAWQRPKFRSAKFNNMKITMKIAMKISPENWKTNLG